MVPKLQATLPETFQNKLQDWLLDWATKSPDPLTAGFSEIVSAIYTLPETDQCHEMVQALMKAIDRVHLLRIFQNGGYQPPPLLMNTAKAVAEFGRDLFLYVTLRDRRDHSKGEAYSAPGLVSWHSAQCHRAKHSRFSLMPVLLQPLEADHTSPPRPSR
jgi:hypothetical protein